jgi:hypothetical protein
VSYQYRPRTHRTVPLGWILTFVAIVVFVGGCVAIVAPSYFERETVTTEVISKERVCDSDGNGGVDCKYLVFTEAGTFQITDAIFGTVRFNSSDVYGKIREGRTYTIVSYGWRLPFLSMYPNVETITVAP